MQHTALFATKLADCFAFLLKAYSMLTLIYSDDDEMMAVITQLCKKHENVSVYCFHSQKKVKSTQGPWTYFNIVQWNF